MNIITEKTQGRVLDRRLIVILLIVFVQLVGASMVLPILPIYAQDRFGMSNQSVTLLNAVFFGAQFLAGPFIGRLSDRYGRVPVLIVSQIGTVISFILLGTAQSTAVLFFARTLDGITGGNIIVAQAYVTDIFPKEKRTQALGYIFASFGVGFIIGPAMGGILSTAFGYETPYLFAAAAAAIVVGMTWVFLDETLTPEQRMANRERTTSDIRFRRVISNMPLVTILLVTFGAQFAFSMLQSTFSLFGKAVLFADQPEMAELGVGLLLATIGIGQVFTQGLLVRPLVNRFGDTPLIVIGGIVRASAMFIVALLAFIFPTIIALFLFAVGSGLQMPALQSLVTTTVNDDERGGVLGLYQSTISLSIIVGSAVSGSFFDIAPRVPFLVGGAVFAAMVFPSIFLVRWAQRRDIDIDVTEVQAIPAGD